MSTISSTPLAARRGVRLALLVAGLCVIGLALTWVLAELVPITHVKDAVALYDFTRLNRPLVEVPANVLLDLLYPPFFAAWGIVLVVLALRRRLLWVALAVAIVLPLAPLSAELLKPLLAHSHDQLGPKYITDASWPSGHATAALTLSWCALLVAPPARRRLVAMLGGAFSLAVGVALLVLAWHMPSDVVGGYLLATLWAALALAILLAFERDGGSRARAHSPLGGSPSGARAMRAWSP
ncbi:MAG TPA: phosphatase PAP2 family protein [Solirubrobacteraceae bacterium]|jgi:membrane-associated phospholipid phosphatase|nr:phosphatase PAP2 family protein [Solirubrobacteraceae bacterium]